MIDTEAAEFDDVAQIRRVQFLVGRGDGRETERSDLRGFAFRQAGGPGRITGQTLGNERSIGFGDHQAHGWIGGTERVQRLGVQMIGVVMAGGDAATMLSSRAGSMTRSVMRTCGLSVAAYFR